MANRSGPHFLAWSGPELSTFLPDAPYGKRFVTGLQLLKPLAFGHRLRLGSGIVARGVVAGIPGVEREWSFRASCPFAMARWCGNTTGTRRLLGLLALGALLVYASSLAGPETGHSRSDLRALGVKLMALPVIAGTLALVLKRHLSRDA